jgi:ribosomal protein L3 glutamine methyltransferase
VKLRATKGFPSSAKKELRTVRDLLRFAVSRFTEAGLTFGHGTHTAWDEAAYLTLHTLHLPIDTLDPFLDTRLLEGEVASVLKVFEQRVVTRKPAAYLTNEAWLGEHSFYVDERVIVPRSYIAELLREDLTPWLSAPERVTSVLDMCTGSGCLAILAALTFPTAKVDAVDLSADALAVAKRNIEDYGLEDRVTPIRSDMFAALGRKRYDIILSNPPYVDAAAMKALPSEYLAEPRMALASGRDGLDHTRQILADARSHLKARGLLVVEIGHNSDVLEAAYPRLPFAWPETSAGPGFVFVLAREDLAN